MHSTVPKPGHSGQRTAFWGHRCRAALEAVAGPEAETGLEAVVGLEAAAGLEAETETELELGFEGRHTAC